MTDDRSPNYRVEDALDALSFSQRGAKRQRGFYLQGGRAPVVCKRIRTTPPPATRP